MDVPSPREGLVGIQHTRCCSSGKDNREESRWDAEETLPSQLTQAVYIQSKVSTSKSKL